MRNDEGLRSRTDLLDRGGLSTLGTVENANAAEVRVDSSGDVGP